ncbi:MAG: putative DNA base hypermodification protein [Planctomycetota bacterium]
MSLISLQRILFRVFNKIETWEALERAFGPITWKNYRYECYDRLLSGLLESKQRIYSAAYIMPSRSGALRSPRKHRNHLRMIEMMMAKSLPARLAAAPSAKSAFLMLRSFPMIGDFLGYQFLTDLNYGPLLNFSEMEFVVAGPGALSGIRKCFSETAGLAPADIIRLVAESQQEQFAKRGIEFPSLYGRALQLIDCQNLFCEIDKYARVAHPEFNAKSGRTRIKQVYRRNAEPLRVWFPPKWHINDAVPESVLAT